jgi:rSAM/selenodomain-associated transferase 2
MISVVIPTLNAQAGLADTLTALVPAFVEGMIREVIIADGGSMDRTLAIADQAGAIVVPAAAGRGAQLQAGAARAHMPWLMFLHADTVLEPGWERDVSAFVQRVDDGRLKPGAACFRFALDDVGARPRAIELGVAARMAVLKMPYGDQGLLIPRALYAETGGYADLPIMEDVEFVRRLGRARITQLRARAITSAARYRQDGYMARTLRNQACLALYALRISPGRIAKFYAPPSRAQ